MSNIQNDLKDNYVGILEELDELLDIAEYVDSIILSDQDDVQWLEDEIKRLQDCVNKYNSKYSIARGLIEAKEKTSLNIVLDESNIQHTTVCQECWDVYKAYVEWYPFDVKHSEALLNVLRMKIKELTETNIE